MTSSSSSAPPPRGGASRGSLQRLWPWLPGPRRGRERAVGPDHQRTPCPGRVCHQLQGSDRQLEHPDRGASPSEGIVAVITCASFLVVLPQWSLEPGTRFSKSMCYAKLTTTPTTSRALAMLCYLTAMATIRLLRAAGEGVVPDLRHDDAERIMARAVHRVLQ